MSLLELGPTIYGPTDDLIAWYWTKRLLAISQDCSNCNVPMRQRTRNDVTDGLVWRYPQCKTTKSIRQGSFFSKSTEMANFDPLGSENTLKKMHQTSRLARIQPVMSIGGWGMCARQSCWLHQSFWEVLEWLYRWTSLFRHKPKVMYTYI